MRTSRDVLSSRREQVQRLPLPLAELLVRALNGKSPHERHHAAFFLGEGALRLLGAAAVAAYRSSGTSDATVERGLAGLARPSMGHWVALLRAVGKATPHPVLQRERSDRPAARAFADGLIAQSVLEPGSAGGVTRDDGFLSLLVRYRNEVIGHGAPRVRAFYEQMTPLLLDAVLEEIEVRPWLAHGGLVLAPEEQEGSWQRLSGLAALPEPAHQGASPGIHVECGEELLGLAPLVEPGFDAALDRDRVLFLNRAVVRRGRVKRTEYLDYGTGESVQLERAAQIEALVAGVDELEDDLTDVEERFGDYVLGEVLGRGAMGVVHRAVQIALGRPVALKQLAEVLAHDEVARRRFQREVRALARCDHPNVAKVLAAGEQDGIPYYVMEFVDGADLGSVARALSPWLRSARAGLSTGHLLKAVQEPVPDEPGSAPPQLEGEDLYVRLAELFAGAAEGLHALHQVGVVHRDVKPANLMLTSDAERLVVMDLGLARIEDGSAGLTAADDRVLGTLRYMAPEQLTSNRSAVDGRADVFGLGASLYELLTGRPRLDGDTRERLSHQLLHEAVPAPRAVQPHIPEALDAIVRRATAREPADRYADAAALARDLRAFVHGEPVQEPVPERTTAPGRPAWALPLLGVSVGGAVVGAVVLGLLRTPPEPPEPQAPAGPPPIEVHVEELEALARYGYVQLDGAGEVFVVYDDGDVYRSTLAAPEQTTNLTADFEPYVHDVAFSADGQRLAMFANEAIYLASPIDAPPKLLVERGSPCGWAPDNQRLAYLVTSEISPSGEAAKADLHVVDATTGKSERWVSEVRSCSVWESDQALWLGMTDGIARATGPGELEVMEDAYADLIGVTHGHALVGGDTTWASRLYHWNLDRDTTPTEIKGIEGKSYESTGFRGTDHALLTTAVSTKRHQLLVLGADGVVERTSLAVPTQVVQAAMLPDGALLLVRIATVPGELNQRELRFNRLDVADPDATEQTIYSRRLEHALVGSVGSSADGEHLYLTELQQVGEHPYVVYDLHVPSGTQTRMFEYPNEVLSAEVAPDGKRMAATTPALEVVVVDVSDGPDEAAVRDRLVQRRGTGLTGWEAVAWMDERGERLMVRDKAQRLGAWTPGERNVEPLAVSGSFQVVGDTLIGVDVDGAVVRAHLDGRVEVLLEAPGDGISYGVNGVTEDGSRAMLVRTDSQVHHLRITFSVVE